MQKTIESVIRQDYENFEYVILDGASTDATPEIIQRYDTFLSYWHSQEDQGVYHAMNDAVAKCTGDFVLFMNAGDTFVDETALKRMFSKTPANADVVYGHHFYVPADGVPDYHPAADFETTWHRLTRGHVWHDWLSGMPGHQATAVRRETLAKLRFDTNYRIAADHDLLFRAKLNGATFFNSDELVSVYVGGGMSAQNYDLCRQEWRAIARTYGDAEAVDLFYRHLDELNIEGDEKAERNIGGDKQNGSNITRSELAIVEAEQPELASGSAHEYDVVEKCFSLIGFDNLEGPYPELKIPHIRWALGPKAQIEIKTGVRPKLARLRLGTWLENQIVKVTVAGEIVAQHKMPLIAENNFAFTELVIDLNQCESGDQVILEFSAWQKVGERSISVMLSGLEST